MLDCTERVKTHHIEDLAGFDGPSLLVYNNAIFSDTDWQSLETRGESLKKEDASSTGKFGIGRVFSYSTNHRLQCSLHLDRQSDHLIGRVYAIVRSA